MLRENQQKYFANSAKANLVNTSILNSGFISFSLLPSTHITVSMLLLGRKSWDPHSTYAFMELVQVCHFFLACWFCSWVTLKPDLTEHKISFRPHRPVNHLIYGRHMLRLLVLETTAVLPLRRRDCDSIKKKSTTRNSSSHRGRADGRSGIAYWRSDQ
jgi:hypothetical protein